MLMHTLLLDGANRFPERDCFHWVDRDKGMSYAAAAAAMDRMAGALHHLGVRKGDRVTVFAHNGLDYLLTMFGSWRIGAIAALVNIKFADELDYYFADHQPTLVVYTHDMVGPVQAAAAKCPSIIGLVCMDGPQDGAHSLPDLLGADLPPPIDPGDETAIAHLSYTSGTTGRPKGAALCHEPTVRASKCIAERLRIDASDISFGPSALSSSYQLVGNLLPQLSRGAAINIMGRWTAETGFDAVMARGATMLIANPPILQDLLTVAKKRGVVPPKLRMSLSGGGPVAPQLKAAWHADLKLPLVESYGQSELGGFVALGLPEVNPIDVTTRRVGRPLPDKEVRILTRQRTEVPVGSVGEIAIRGGYMAGYWNKPEKTAEAIHDSWLWTGDLGSIDPDGFVTMRGRRAELLTVGDIDWYPRDVEEALCTHADVEQAAVVGVPDATLGTRPVAFVQSSTTLDLDALKALAGSALPYNLAPMQIVALAELPMTPTGKIAKSDLSARARASL